MKRIFLSICILAAVSAVCAQTQKGYVKTRGRLNANGTVIHGSRLSGATITFQGNGSATSGTNGAFTFAVKNNTFCITNVRKNGYQLYDSDLLGRPHNYSANDLLVVMDTPDNVLADKLSSEKKIRRTLQKQLMEKEDELEAMKEQQKITEEQYRKQLQELYAEQENNEKLISEMAERYSTMDFDQMDEFQRRVAIYIQNGELTRADSLLNTKGSMEERSAELDRENAAIEANAEELKKRQEEQAKSEALYAKKLEDFAADCYSRYKMCLLQHKNDSVAYWLELRASKDTLNYDWQIEAGDVLGEFERNYAAALHHYMLALYAIKSKYGEINRDIAIVYNKIGKVYLSQSEEKALDYFQKALDIQNRILDSNHIDKVETYSGLSTLYLYQSNDTSAIEMLQNALNIAILNCGETSWEVADIYTAIGSVYFVSFQYGKAALYYNKANLIREKLYPADNLKMVSTYLSKAALNAKQPSLYIRYSLKALDLLIQYYGEMHPQVADVCFMLGAQYNNMSDYANALLYLGRAASIYLKVLGENHQNTKMANQSLGYLLMKYEYDKRSKDNRIENNDESIIVKEYKSAMVYTATILNDDDSDSQEVTNEEYIVLEYADWVIDSDESLFVKQINSIETPETALLMVDGVIVQRPMENSLGVMIGYRYVGEDLKQQILKAYKEWKEKQ